MKFTSCVTPTALVLLCLTATSSFAQPAGRGFGRLRFVSSPVDLAANLAVQKDLGVTGDQAESIKRLSDEFRAELQGLSAESQTAPIERRFVLAEIRDDDAGYFDC